MKAGITIKSAREIALRHGSEKIVIVASRRTDMPRFYLEELIRGLKEGCFHPQGLMQKVWQLRFSPEEVHSVGLWSQDFSHWIRERPRLDRPGYRFWYRFTILPDDPLCKPKAPKVSEQLAQARQLAEMDGAEAVSFCIDPFFRYRTIDDTRWIDIFTKENLEPIISTAGSLNIRKITVSFIDYYKKVENRARRHGIEFEYPDTLSAQGREYLTEKLMLLSTLCLDHGIELRTCCEPFAVTEDLAVQGRCVDGAHLSRLYGPGASLKPDQGQRRGHGCGCTCSVDVGRYTSRGPLSHHCSHQCPQCYARR